MNSFAPKTRAVRSAAAVLAFALSGGCGAPPVATPKVSPGAPASPAGSAKPPAAKTVAAKQLEADTTVSSPSGASFEGAKGWYVTDLGDRIVLESPERDLTLTWLEIANATDGTHAIDSAWKRIDPSFALKTKQATHPPAKDGWDAITQVVYDVPLTAKRTMLAIARRKATTEYVVVVDGADAALDRRGAQLTTALSTFKAAGVREESLAGRAAHAFDAARAKALEEFVRVAMEKAKVPGAAIAVVEHGKVVFEKGFGVRELGKNELVTPKTLFMIGSTTKSLTTLLMAKLVDEKKFAWDTPVTEVLPSFGLADPATTRQVLLKHTVCACTGMPRQDMEFIFEHASVSPEMRMAAMHAMKPTTGFGETFQYSNSMVAAGGYVAGHVFAPAKAIGPAYDGAMQARVFDPLEMKSTTFDAGVASRREHASPHGFDVRGNARAMKPSDEGFVVAVRPAGGAWSNASDMGKYLQVELAKGRDAKGATYVTEANLLARRQPQVKITDKLSYGMGLFTENDHGVTVVHHGGNTLGFTSDLFFLPESDVGVVVLTNVGGPNTFRTAVRRRILELLFDATEEAGKTLDFGVTRRKEAIEKEAAKIAPSPDLAWAKSFTGSYANDGLGSVTLRADGLTLTFDAGEWKSGVGTRREADGTSTLVLLDPPVAGLEVVASEGEGKKRLTIDAGQHAYVFEPQAVSKGR